MEVKQEDIRRLKNAMHEIETISEDVIIPWKDDVLKSIREFIAKQPTYTNHSGGAVGSDYEWGTQGEAYGVVSKHYWHGKQTAHGNTEITEEEFNEGKEHVMKANETLHRQPNKYMDLLARNWCQVKNADEIFAIGHIKNGIVDGGTGWAVQMAIDVGKVVHLYDQERCRWFTHDGQWAYSDTPTLTRDFAGIGTRNINQQGIEAIAEVYRKTFE